MLVPVPQSKGPGPSPAACLSGNPHLLELSLTNSPKTPQWLTEMARALSVFHIEPSLNPH